VDIADQIETQRLAELRILLHHALQRAEKGAARLAVDRASMCDRDTCRIGRNRIARRKVVGVIAVGHDRDAAVVEPGYHRPELLWLAGRHDGDLRRIRENGASCAKLPPLEPIAA